MADSPDTLRRLWFVGFAGHRAVADPAAAKIAIARELKVLRETVTGEMVGISSAAAGADLLFLDACTDAGLKTIVLLPFSRERFALDFDDPAEWPRACMHIDAAWWTEVSPGGEDAPAAYHVVARECLEVADRMLFFWNGEGSRGLGGTAETVTEARERRIPSRLIHAHTLEAVWDTPPAKSPGHDSDFADLPPAATVEDLFHKLDARASAGAPRSRWFSAGSMSLNHLATILQVVLVSFALAAEEAGALMKLIIVTVAALLPWIGGRLRWQERWIRDRVRAELLRSLLNCHEPASPLRPPAVDLFGKEEAFLRTASMRLVHTRQGWQHARDHYLRERVDGQIGYLRSKGELATKRMAVFGKIFWLASWVAMILGSIGVVTAYLNAHFNPTIEASMSFCASLLPGIAAWCLAMISVFEFKRRASLYRQLVDELIRLRPKLSAASCASEVTRAMVQIERLLLNELWEWQGSRKK